MKTCAKCNGDCHEQNILNFAASTRWRDKYDALLQLLAQIRGDMLRWAKQCEGMEKDSGKIEWHYGATNYREYEQMISNTIERIQE